MRGILLLLTGFLALGFGQVQIPKATPDLYFSYSEIYDYVCSHQTKKEIEEAWAKEAEERLGEFEELWKQNGAQLLSTLYSEVGRGYSRKEMRVTLSVCDSISMSDPFVVNIRRYLKSDTPEKAPAPNFAFVNLVFHEFLHNYLVENLNWDTSPLYLKYKGESNRVKYHLHLMALQIHIHKLLGNDEVIAWLEGNNQRIGHAYERAWNIVKAEGHGVFVRDLKENLAEVK